MKVEALLLFVCLFVFGPRIAAFRGADILVRALPMKSRTKLGRDVMYISDIHDGRVHAVTTLVKMECHGRDFAIFKRRPFFLLSFLLLPPPPFFFLKQTSVRFLRPGKLLYFLPNCCKVLCISL